jgi:ribosomal protein S18 acetylase RimI-like enzyme
MAVTLRTATPDDLDAILGLWRDAAENRSRPADTRESVAGLLDRDPLALVVAVDQVSGELVGTIIVGWDGWRGHLYRLAVRPDRRREGIGQLLIRASEDRCQALGASRIDAMVLDNNDLGQTIWVAAGYTKQHDWRRWVKPLVGPPEPIASSD